MYTMSNRVENIDSSRTQSAGCPVEATLNVIGGKWKGIALYHLLVDGTLRFNELKRRVGNVTQRMLTKQLRELEEDGLINRHVYAEVPPKVEYSLTEKGKTLSPILIALREWGVEHVFQAPAAADEA